MQNDQKAFSVALRKVKQYENKVIKAVRFVEINSNTNLLQKSNNSDNHKSMAIRRTDRTVVHEVREVLDAWKEHFTKLEKLKD